MSNSIGDLLSQKAFFEPPEIKIIKDFVDQTFQVKPTVAVGDREIIIGVSSAALAGALRPHLFELQRECKTTKRLVIRIQ